MYHVYVLENESGRLYIGHTGDIDRHLPLAAVPVVALVCNLIVSTQGSVVLIRRGFAAWGILRPLLLTSVPCAFLGGVWRLPESAFLVILAVALTLAGGSMLLQNLFEKKEPESPRDPPKGALIGTGVLLGLLAGMTGIGGGIYLAPIMYLFGWARAQTMAACTSMFIALNSLAGLLGQFTKGADVVGALPVWILIGCPVAVVVGGRLGSHLLTERLHNYRIRAITASVILLVACRLWIKVLF